MKNKERVHELMNKVLGEESEKLATGRVARELGKTFETGKDITKECEQYEHLIEQEGEEAFLKKVKEIINRKQADEPT